MSADTPVATECDRDLLAAVLHSIGWVDVGSTEGWISLADPTGLVTLQARHGDVTLSDPGWSVTFDADVPNRVIFGAVAGQSRRGAGEPVAP